MIEPNSFIHGDCMDYLKDYPDKYFDLAIVDPPYGGGTHLVNGRRKGQEQPIWTREKVRWAVRQVQSPFSKSSSQSPDDEQKITATRVGGDGRKSSVKKSYRGTLPQRKNTLMSSSVSHEIRLFGAVITSNCHPQDALSCGEKLIYQ